MSEGWLALDPSALMPSGLCGTCDEIFKGDFDPCLNKPHHQSRCALELAAELGCYICRTIQKSRRWMANRNRQNENQFVYNLSQFANRYEVKIHSNDVWSFSEESWSFRTLSRDFCDELSKFHRPPSRPNDSTVGELAIKWSASCKENHTRCNSVSSSSFFPKRVIQIIDYKHAKLVVFDKTPNERLGSYVALSHRWGKSEMPKLLRTNQNEFRRFIDVGKLPKNFQEAISICLRLGLAFIWIDCLCIIQDSDKDWQEQAPQMHHIYGNAFLNLCATAEDDNSPKDSTWRDARLIRPLKVNPDWKGRNTEGFGLMSDPLEDEILSSPLRHRGWVFQEWYLSKRSMILGRTQLWWHCHEQLVCEGIPIPFSPQGNWILSQNWRRHARAMKLEDEPLLQDRGHSSDYNERDLHNIRAQVSSWISHLESYAQTEFTEESDRLMAFSGIAQAFGDANGIDIKAQYIAGLWKYHLPGALCWAVSYSTLDIIGPTCRSSKYKAPSWTWASVDGPFQLHSNNFGSARPCATVTDVTLHYVNESNVTGLVKGGIIKICGHLIGPGRIRFGSYFSISCLVSASIFLKRDIPSSDSRGICWDERDISGDPVISYFDHLEPENRKHGLVEGASRINRHYWEAEVSFFFLPILFQDGYNIHGIILFQPSHQPDIFYRVGYWNSGMPPDIMTMEDLAKKYIKKEICII